RGPRRALRRLRLRPRGAVPRAPRPAPAEPELTTPYPLRAPRRLRLESWNYPKLGGRSTGVPHKVVSRRRRPPLRGRPVAFHRRPAFDRRPAPPARITLRLWSPRASRHQTAPL